MDSNQWMTQEMSNGGMRGIAMGEIASSSGGSSGDRKLQLARPQKDKVVNCPRCNSTNTKFCYYNNYSLTQPRYFCKSCRRYWTEGGTLRNVPVGGGSRKHKRSTSVGASSTTLTPPPSSASASAVMSSSHKMNSVPDLNPPNMNFLHHGNPSMDRQGQDLNLGGYHFDQLMKSSTATTSSALELLRTGALLGSNSPSNDFMSTNAIYANNNGGSSGFSFQELKPGSGGMSFSSSVHHANIGGIQENGGRMMFPFGGMMKNMAVPSSTTVITTTAADHDQVNGDGRNNQVSNPNGFWNAYI